MNADAKDAIKSGIVDDAFEHYLRHGIDANKYSLIRREATALACSVDRFLVSEFRLLPAARMAGGRGCDPPRFRLVGGEFNVELPVRRRSCAMRARDVEQVSKAVRTTMASSPLANRPRSRC